MLQEDVGYFFHDERGLNERVREHCGFQYQIIKDQFTEMEIKKSAHALF